MSHTSLSDYPDVLTVDDLRQILRIGKASAYALLKTHQLEYRKIGRIYRISKKSLLEYLNNHKSL